MSHRVRNIASLNSTRRALHVADASKCINYSATKYFVFSFYLPLSKRNSSVLYFLVSSNLQIFCTLLANAAFCLRIHYKKIIKPHEFIYDLIL